MARHRLWMWLIPLALAAVWGLSMLGPDRDDPAAPAAEPEAPSSPVPALPPPPPTPTPSPTPEPTPSATPSPSPQATPTAVPAGPTEQTPSTALRPSDVYPAAFEQEARDPTWAPEAEAKIRSAFSEAKVPEGSLLKVECRAALCKIDLLFDRKKQFFYALAYSHLHKDFALEMGFDRDSDPSAIEPERLSAYVPRKGYRMTDFVQ